MPAATPPKVGSLFEELPEPVQEQKPAPARPIIEQEPSSTEESKMPPRSAFETPRHFEFLQDLQTQEVAQRSYKKSFKESRQELIERLIDPPLTLEEVARLLNVCPTTVRRYTSRGLLTHYRTVGNQRRFRLSDVVEFIESQQARTRRRPPGSRSSSRPNNPF